MSIRREVSTGPWSNQSCNWNWIQPAANRFSCLTGINWSLVINLRSKKTIFFFWGKNKTHDHIKRSSLCDNIAKKENNKTRESIESSTSISVLCCHHKTTPHNRYYCSGSFCFLMLSRHKYLPATPGLILNCNNYMRIFEREVWIAITINACSSFRYLFHQFHGFSHTFYLISVPYSERCTSHSNQL